MVLYSILVVVAATWSALAGRPWIVLDPQVATWPRTGLGLAAGLVLGALVVWLSRITVARWGWARTLYRWFSAALGPLTRREVLALAGMSAVGEEMLFRGAMQPSLGLWITSLVFALAHLPPRLALWPWTLSAGLMGLGFGLITRFCGSLAGAVAAHFVINLLNLGHVARLTTPEVLPDPAEKLPTTSPPPSMGTHERKSAVDDPAGRERSGAGDDPARGPSGQDRG